MPKSTKTHELHIPGGLNFFKKLTQELLPYHTAPVGSHLFIVEGTIAKPRIGIRYPGYKLKQRTLKRPNKNSALWANLYDFEVVPFEKWHEGSSVGFTYANLLKDFENAKYNYQRFIDKYPNHALVHDTKILIENLGKSPEELIKSFQEKENINKSQNN